MNNNSIGSFLAALRKANGMTQKELAEKLNVSDKAVSRWERDECAPDLSLIPILAEIYGVTCDEILRGQRAAPKSDPTPQPDEKSKKRLNYLLNQIKTTYKIRSLISCFIAIIGLIAAMMFDLGFNRAYLGFLCGAIFFVAAAICQTIFCVQSNAAPQNEDFDPDILRQYRHRLLRLTQWAYSVIAVLFAFTLPLLSVPDAYWGLTFDTWLGYGFLAALFAAALCLLIGWLIDVKMGTAKFPNLKAPLSKLRLRTLGILATVLLITLALQWFAALCLSELHYLYGDTTRFDDWESFKAYMEQPTTESGDPITFVDQSTTTENGYEFIVFTDAAGVQYWYDAEFLNQTVHAPDGSVLCTYRHFNHSVCHVEYAWDNDRLPVYIQSSEQYAEASRRFDWIMLGWLPIYLAEAAILFLRYRKKIQAPISTHSTNRQPRFNVPVIGFFSLR